MAHIVRRRFTASEFFAHDAPRVQFENERFDFELSPRVLDRGDIQVHSRLARKCHLDGESLEAIQAIDLQGILEDETLTHLSCQKLAFVIPNKRAADFDEALLTNPAYIAATTTNTELEPPQTRDGNFRVRRHIGMYLDDVVTEFCLTTDTLPPTDPAQRAMIQAVEEGLGPCDRWIHTCLVESSSRALRKSVYLTQLYDLPDGSGVLWVNRVVAAFAEGSASRAELAVLGAARGFLYRREIDSAVRKLAIGARAFRLTAAPADATGRA